MQWLQPHWLHPFTINHWRQQFNITRVKINTDPALSSCTPSRGQLNRSSLQRLDILLQLFVYYFLRVETDQLDSSTHKGREEVSVGMARLDHVTLDLEQSSQHTNTYTTFKREYLCGNTLFKPSRYKLCLSKYIRCALAATNRIFPEES